MASSCSLSGLYANVQQQLISSQSNLYQYGVLIGLGNPSQNSSLWPSIIHNETSFRTADFCVSDDSIQCFSTSNGNVSSVPSTTWQDNSTYKSLDDPSVYTNVSRQYGSDILDIWSDQYGSDPTNVTLLHDFPITLVPNYSSTSDHFLGPGDTFGLGSASTVLDRLYSLNLIASKSYGLYVGTTTSAVPDMQNGSLILGGYDAARFSGPVHTYDQVAVSAANGFSPFKLTITSMSFNVGSGSPIELIDQGGFDAYLTTAQYPVQFPRSVTQKLADSVSAVGASNDDNTLRMPVGFNGNLTVTMADGFQVVFNSSWLSDSFGVSPISAAPLDNSTNSGTSFNSTSPNDKESPSLFGIAFLEQVYLIVSYDNSPPSFSLAKANPASPFFVQEPLCPNVTPQAVGPQKTSRFEQQGLIGAVLGGTIGGIAIIIAIFITVRFMLRKRRELMMTETKLEVPPTPSKLQSMRDSLGRLRFRSDKSVRFASGHVSISSTDPSRDKLPTSHLTTVRSVSRDHDSDSDSTRVSISNASVTNLDRKNPSSTTTTTTGQRPASSNLLSRVPLNFGFSSPRTPRFPRDSRNPYVAPPVPVATMTQGGHRSSRWRSSSIYSSDV